jgi:alpha,alpha-trehalose phosphorylase
MNPASLPTDPVDRVRFPVDEWRLIETAVDESDLGATETLFAVANGYLGMRGNPEEGRPAHNHGTYINGYHETWPIQHAEEAFGFARTGQTIVNVPDAKVIKLYIDDEPLSLPIADLLEYERWLDFREGILRRHVVWRTPSGKLVRIDSTRMVSFTERHLAVMTLAVTMLDGAAPVVISSQVLNRQDGMDEYSNKSHNGLRGVTDPRKASAFGNRVLEPEGDWHSEQRMILGYRCAHSRMTLGVGADHTIETENTYEELISTEPDVGKKVYRIVAQPGRPILITKTVTYHTSRGVPVRELFDRCRRTLDRVRDRGIAAIHDEQADWLARFWANSDVAVSGQSAAQQAIRWSLYQLAQAAARADQLGVPAKGVTGSGYEGHYFWDTEIYVVPFLTFTNPSMARNTLRFRVNIVGAARERARELSQRGVLFPWRTINGEEASAYYAAGTAQYHIDADVAFAFAKYADVTGDRDFMHRQGIDILVETARMWADLGFWRVHGEQRDFHIHGVTGPDEYTTVVNNNLFTNVMARFNLARAAELLREMAIDAPAMHALAVQRLGIAEDEVDEWEACAAGMFIPYDDTLEVHPQDDHFLDREIWDLGATPPELRPLLLHFHPLVIYRFQVLKQADVVLALFLQGDYFTSAEKRADFEYYDPITTGDSTLSAVVQSIIAAEVGYHEMALRYFLTGLYVDIADLHRNTSDGVHVASAGGVWNALVYGFAGMRDHRGCITFDPRLPAGWDELNFPLRIRGSRVRVQIVTGAIEFTIEEGAGLDLTVRGQAVRVDIGQPVRIILADQGARRTSLQGSHPVIGAHRADGSVITAGVPDWEARTDQIPIITDAVQT